MSSAAARAAAKAAKTAERGFLKTGAKRDPELYVRARSAIARPRAYIMAPLTIHFILSMLILCADSYGRHLWRCWLRWLLSG